MCAFFFILHTFFFDIFSSQKLKEEARKMEKFAVLAILNTANLTILFSFFSFCVCEKNSSLV